MAKRPMVVTSREVAKVLHSAGLIPGDLNRVQRIVIDLEQSQPAKMYVSYLGDERWLEVLTHAVEGVQVVTHNSTHDSTHTGQHGQ